MNVEIALGTMPVRLEKVSGGLDLWKLKLGNEEIPLSATEAKRIGRQFKVFQQQDRRVVPPLYA